MTPEEEAYIRNLELSISSEKNRRIDVENRMSTMSASPSVDNLNLAQQQLDLDKELERLERYLGNYESKMDEAGNQFYVRPDDKSKWILTTYGVKEIMEIVQIYLNKNFLLTNLDEENLYKIMHTFSEALNDKFLIEAEHIYYYPTAEEYFEKYKDALGIYNDKYNTTMTKKDLYEFCKLLSLEELRKKFSKTEMYVYSLSHSVYATLLRALNGEERESLRKQLNIHQSLSDDGRMQMQQPTSLFKPTTWKK